MGNYSELVYFFRDRTGVRIIIPDNNNIQFCNRNDRYFTEQYFCADYDLVLVPGWVHAEVSHSKKRLGYLSALPKTVLYMIEEDDYLPLIGYHDERLIRLFKLASSPHQSCQRVLNEFFNKTVDLPDDWVHIEGQSYPSGITLQLDEISLKR